MGYLRNNNKFRKIIEIFNYFFVKILSFNFVEILFVKEMITSILLPFSNVVESLIGVNVIIVLCSSYFSQFILKVW